MTEELELFRTQLISEVQSLLIAGSEKISAMPSASEPLSGSELIPLVQGGNNVKATVSNLPNSTNILYQVADTVTPGFNIIERTGNASETNFLDFSSPTVNLTSANGISINGSSQNSITSSATSGWELTSNGYGIELNGQSYIIKNVNAGITPNIFYWNTSNGAWTYGALANPSNILYQVADTSNPTGNIIYGIGSADETSTIICDEVSGITGISSNTISFVGSSGAEFVSTGGDVIVSAQNELLLESMTSDIIISAQTDLILSPVSNLQFSALNSAFTSYGLYYDPNTNNVTYNLSNPGRLYRSGVQIPATGTPTTFQSYSIPGNTAVGLGDKIVYEQRCNISYNLITLIGDTLSFSFAGNTVYTFTASNVGSTQSICFITFEVEYFNVNQANWFIKIVQGPHSETNEGTISLLNWANPQVIQSVGTHLSGAGSFISNLVTINLN